jgi:hypothetical protein
MYDEYRGEASSANDSAIELDVCNQENLAIENTIKKRRIQIKLHTIRFDNFTFFVPIFDYRR